MFHWKYLSRLNHERKRPKARKKVSPRISPRSMVKLPACVATDMLLPTTREKSASKIKGVKKVQKLANQKAALKSACNKSKNEKKQQKTT